MSFWAHPAGWTASSLRAEDTSPAPERPAAPARLADVDADADDSKPASSPAKEELKNKPDKGERTGAAAPKPNPAAAAEARQVLKSARDRLVSFRSIKARIIESVAIGDRRFKAEGSYIQGSELRLRLEFTVKSGTLTGNLLEVCDGQVLWSRYTVGKSLKITRRDVRQILEAARNAPQNPEGVRVAELGLGGLPALLASVEQTMSFTGVREETIDGQAFTVLEGSWGPDFWAQWKAVNPKSPDKLPEHIPDNIRIYLDQKTHLPRRFLYLKKPSDGTTLRPMVTVDFVDLVLNAPISDDEFYFVPPDGVPPDDITRAYLDRLRAPTGAAVDDAK